MMLKLTLFERILHRLHLLPAPVMDAFGGVLFGHALALAVRRGVFEVLAAGGAGAEALAAQTGLGLRGVRLLLEGFTAAGYLTRRGERYLLTASARKWLLADSPDTLVHLVGYFETLYPRWGQLESTLERGRPARPYYETFTEGDWRTYVLGMRDLARLLLPQVIGPLTAHRQAERLLDIGGSHGLYAFACCRRLPRLQALIADFPPALVHAAAAAREEGLSSRVEFLPGDFRWRELPGGQDIVLLFNIIHGLTAEENRGLLARARETLRAGGRLYILDQLNEPHGRSPLSRFLPVMVGLNLMNEIGGASYSFDEVRSWCGGFGTVRRIRLRFPGVTLVEAKAAGANGR